MRGEADDLFHIKLFAHLSWLWIGKISSLTWSTVSRPAERQFEKRECQLPQPALPTRSRGLPSDPRVAGLVSILFRRTPEIGRARAASIELSCGATACEGKTGQCEGVIGPCPPSDTCHAANVAVIGRMLYHLIQRTILLQVLKLSPT